MGKQPFVVTKEWLEALQSRYFALNKADSDVLVQWALEAWDAMEQLKASLDASIGRANDELGRLGDFQERLGDTQERERRLKEALEDCVSVMDDGDGASYELAKALLKEVS